MHYTLTHTHTLADTRMLTHVVSVCRALSVPPPPSPLLSLLAMTRIDSDTPLVLCWVVHVRRLTVFTQCARPPRKKKTRAHLSLDQFGVRVVFESRSICKLIVGIPRMRRRVNPSDSSKREAICRVCQGYPPSLPWDTHYQFSIQTFCSDPAIVR